MFSDIEPIPLKELDTNTELLQTGFWGSFKSGFGWQAIGIRTHLDKLALKVLVLLRPLKLNLFLAYIPYGLNEIEDRPDRESLLTGFARKLKTFLPAGTVFVRYDLAWGQTGKDNLPGILEPVKGLQKAPVDIQPLSTVILDLSPLENEILDQMKHKTRYNIRLANRKGVETVEARPEELNEWYRLYQETGKRDKISIHSFEYYKGLFDLASLYGDGAPKIKFFTARIDGQMAGGIINIHHNQKAWYLYGASSGYKRNYMPNHGLQWFGIQTARNLGCRTYDLFGIPPKEDKNHPMYGLYRFKTGFGGTIINRYGCYDAVLRPAAYFSLKQGEGLRNFYYKVIKKNV